MKWSNQHMIDDDECSNWLNRIIIHKFFVHVIKLIIYKYLGYNKYIYIFDSWWCDKWL